MKNNELQLPVAIPPVSCLQYESHLFAILYTNNAFLPWIYSNYIQIWMHKKGDLIFGNYFTSSIYVNSCPYIFQQIIDRNTVSGGYSDTVDFVINSIKNKNYVIAPMDHKALSAAKYEDVQHETLIYGFNYQHEILYLADFVQGKYQFFTCSFNEFRESYEKVHQEKDLVWDTFRLWRIEDNKFFWQESISAFSGFNLNYTIRLLEDYYSGFNSYKHFGWMPASNADDIESRKYGIECYNELIEYVSGLKSSLDGRNAYAMPFYLLYAQKKMMEFRLHYINSEILTIPKELFDELQELQKYSRVVVMKILKIKLINDLEVRKALDETIRMLYILKDKDSHWGEQLIKVMKTEGYC